MGTGHQGMLTLCAGRMICRIIAAFKGWKYRSTFVDSLSFGGFNKKFEPGETSKEWITSDKKKRDEYVRDRCVPIHLHWEPIIRCLPV